MEPALMVQLVVGILVLILWVRVFVVAGKSIPWMNAMQKGQQEMIDLLRRQQQQRQASNSDMPPVPPARQSSIPLSGGPVRVRNGNSR